MTKKAKQHITTVPCQRKQIVFGLKEKASRKPCCGAERNLRGLPTRATKIKTVHTVIDSARLKWTLASAVIPQWTSALTALHLCAPEGHFTVNARANMAEGSGCRLRSSCIFVEKVMLNIPVDLPRSTVRPTVLRNSHKEQHNIIKDALWPPPSLSMVQSVNLAWFTISFFYW